MRVLVFVDQPLMHDGPWAPSPAGSGIEVVAEAADSATAADAYARHRPDMMLLALRGTGAHAQDVLGAIRTAHPEARVVLLTEPDQAPAPAEPHGRNGPRFSPREVAVLELLARGLKNRSIGTSLQISEAMVKYHLQQIYNKLGVSDRTEAAVVALRRGLIPR
jgi:DNA-binding NarL/FixJ family response regulator